MLSISWIYEAIGGNWWQLVAILGMKLERKVGMSLERSEKTFEGSGGIYSR